MVVILYSIERASAVYFDIFRLVANGELDRYEAAIEIAALSAILHDFTVWSD